MAKRTIGNRLFFYFQTNRERKIDNKKIGRKKGFLSFYSVCMFVYVCVYMCVCVFVCLLALYRLHRLTLGAEMIDTYKVCVFFFVVQKLIINKIFRN